MTPEQKREIEEELMVRVRANQQEMRDLETVLARVGSEAPKELMFSIMEVLVDVACGTNPHLRDHHRLQVYRAIARRLEEKGIR